MLNLCKSLTRRKTHNIDDIDTELKRVLTLLDLTALGVGSTLGLGVYVLAGQVAYNIAGPAVILSFIIAGVASFFAAICYAEFATRVPRSGSAYVYSYVTVGEFVAFSIGWNMILEYIIGTASLARGLSAYLDEFLDNKMSKALTEAMPIKVSFLANYPDFLSFTSVLLLTAILAFGVRESSYFNLICTCLNLLTIVVVIGAGSFHANIFNWNIPSDKVPIGFGSGGFMPFGIAGVMRGAAKCFFGFVGFDGISTTAEEAINPKRNIPLSIMLSLLIVFFAYFGISTVLTLMVPYFEQSPTAPFPAAFGLINWITIKWIVSIGAIFALMTALLGAMFPLPRILYAMAFDGLIFEKFAKINSYTQTPMIATIIAGFLAAIMALIFELGQLVDMMSIGTLMAYTIVAICVLVLRYQDEAMEKPANDSINLAIRQLFNRNCYSTPNVLTSGITKIAITAFGFISLVWCTILKFYDINSTIGVIATSTGVTLAVIILYVIAMQPVSKVKVTFRVPLMPFIPAISVLINLYLMFQLDLPTWVRFLVWTTMGYIIYFSYGLTYSKQRNHENK